MQRLAREALHDPPNLRACTPRASRARQAALARYEVEIAPVVVHHRIDHVHAFTSGRTAQEAAPRSKAAAELEALFTWLRKGAFDLGEST